MKQEVCVLPVRCKGCSRVFDLWYDLQQEEERGEDLRTGSYLMDESARRLLNQSFCWSCRKVISGDAGPKEEPDKIPEEVVLEEYDLSLAFE